MAEQSYEAAVQTLRSRLGNQWAGTEADGWEEMLRVLQGELGFSRAQAEGAITAMLRTGQIRYERAAERGRDSTVEEPSPVLANPSATGAGGLPAAPVASGAEFGPGYWIIGRERDEDLGGRRGQVDPL